MKNILNIMLPLTLREDILRWPFTKNRCISVNSAYHRLRDRARVVDDETS